MRTTLDIDQDVLGYVKEKAQIEGTTIGKVLSEMARAGIEKSLSDYVNKNGFPVLKRRSGPMITPEFIKSLLDETE